MIVGSVIFPLPGQIWNLKLWVMVVGGSFIFPRTGQIWNLKFLVMGDQSSFYDQAKSEIGNFQWWWGVSHLSVTNSFWNLKVSVMGGPSFLALVHHPNLGPSVSTGFAIGHHKGPSNKRPITRSKHGHIYISLPSVP